MVYKMVFDVLMTRGKKLNEIKWLGDLDSNQD